MDRFNSAVGAVDEYQLPHVCAGRREIGKFGGKTAGGLPVDGGDVRRQVRVRVRPPPMGAVRVQ